MGEQGIDARVCARKMTGSCAEKAAIPTILCSPDRVHAAFAHSPHAHAKITSVDTSKAKKAPRVVAVLTGTDWAANEIGGMPCGFAPDGGPQNAPPRPALVA